MVVQKPIKVVRISLNVVAHDLPKALIVGNHKQVDHNHISYSVFVDQLWHVDFAECIKNDEVAFRILLDIFLQICENLSRELLFSHWQQQNFYGVFVWTQTHSLC